MNAQPLAKSELIDAEETSSEAQLMATLRPKTLADYIGQTRTKRRLGIALRAAQKTGEPLPHTLLAGPPGTGKTTLSNIAALELGGRLVQTTGMALKSIGSATGVMMSIQAGDVLFIDEIHRMPMVVEEFLYTVMEDFKLFYVVGSGPEAIPIEHPLPKFTMVGATTLAGDLSAPLRDRFGLQYTLELYEDADLASIVSRSALVMQQRLGPGAALEIARRSRGTPRIANRLLARVRDFYVAEVDNGAPIMVETVREALELEGIDACGLDDLDRRYLRTLIENYKGGPAGVEALAATMQIDTGTLKNVVEPFLLRTGYLKRTPYGREVTDKAKGAAYAL